MRRGVALLLGVVVAACVGDPYPMPSSAPNAGSLHPAAVGSPVRSVVLFLTPRPGDTIELLGAEPVGLGDGAVARFYLSRPVLRANGDRDIGTVTETLEGAEVAVPASAPAGPDNSVGIVAEVTASRPGRYELSSVRLRYSLNDGFERVGTGIDVVMTVCADEPAPRDCPEEPAG